MPSPAARKREQELLVMSPPLVDVHCTTELNSEHLASTTGPTHPSQEIATWCYSRSRIKISFYLEQLRGIISAVQP